MKSWGIPQTLETRGESLYDASLVLAGSAVDLAREEFRLLENSTRGKKIRAHSAVHVAEKAVQFVGIVKKLGIDSVPTDAVSEIQDKIALAKEKYSLDVNDEEEDDVL